MKFIFSMKTTRKVYPLLFASIFCMGATLTTQVKMMVVSIPAGLEVGSVFRYEQTELPRTLVFQKQNGVYASYSVSQEIYRQTHGYLQVGAVYLGSRSGDDPQTKIYLFGQPDGSLLECKGGDGNGGIIPSAASSSELNSKLNWYPTAAQVLAPQAASVSSFYLQSLKD